MSVSGGQSGETEAGVRRLEETSYNRGLVEQIILINQTDSWRMRMSSEETEASLSVT